MRNGKLCGAVDTCGSKGNKRYNMGKRAEYSATLDAAGMAALNPRCGGNGALLLNVSKRKRGKQCGASDDTRGSMGKKRYNVGNRAGY